jgi:hypothetical protein
MCLDAYRPNENIFKFGRYIKKKKEAKFSFTCGWAVTKVPRAVFAPFPPTRFGGGCKLQACPAHLSAYVEKNLSSSDATRPL